MPSTDKHYSPAIAVRLRHIASERQWSLLPEYLSTLSNANFRTAGYMIAERTMPVLPADDFWSLFSTLFQLNAKAFFVSMLKAIPQAAKSNGMDIADFIFREDALKAMSLTTEDQRKGVALLLPLMDSPEDANRLFNIMNINDSEQRISLCLTNLSYPSAFLLLQELRRHDDNKMLLLRTANFLIREKTSLSFNMASLLKAYFGLDEIKGVFSLNIPPYELARLTSDYQTFKKRLTF